MRQNQLGSILYVYTQFDMSAYITLQIIMTLPNGQLNTVTATLGTTPLTNPDGTVWPANQYVSYIFKTGDLATVGTYQVQVLYIDSTQKIQSDTTSFVVYP